MFGFYKMFFSMGYLKIDDVKEACKWKCISEAEYKEITGEDYTI